ncbi:MAG: biopolymer transporter ExbD [bacterium]|nr:biopolymer transporter ExbD [bacterium]
MSPTSTGRGGRDEKLIDGINITPMVDIILVILVIFMVTTSLVHEASLPVDLPDARATRSSHPERLTVTVDAGGEIYLSREPSAISLERLQSLLTDTAGANPEIHVELRADRKRPYGEIIDVLSAIRGAGIGSVGFAVAGS